MEDIKPLITVKQQELNGDFSNPYDEPISSKPSKSEDYDDRNSIYRQYMRRFGDNPPNYRSNWSEPDTITNSNENWAYPDSNIQPRSK